MSQRRTDIASKMKSLRQRLDEMKEYKRILSEDGLKPDSEDKRIESEIIQRLLGLEKDLARMDAARQGSSRVGASASGAARGKKGEAPARGMLKGVKKDFATQNTRRRSSSPAGR